MFSDWPSELVNQVVAVQAKYASDFEKFAVSASNSKKPTVGRLKDDAAVERFVDEPAGRVNYLRLLIQPGYPGITQSLLDRVVNKFHLPVTYQQTRTYANASGAFLKFSNLSPEGRHKRRSFIFRCPYSTGEFKSNWSLAWSWDAETGEITGLFDGASDVDLDLVASYLLHRQKYIGHPLLIHLMILEILCHFSVARRNIHQRILYELEVRLGVTRGYYHRIAGNQDVEALKLELAAAKSSREKTALVYFERRLSYLKSFAEDVEKILHEPNLIGGDLRPDTLATATPYFMEVVSNCQSFLDNQMHLCLCLQKRTQGLNDAIYILLAQRDNRAILSLGHAAKIDSSSMRAISMVAMFFLPGTFVASIFGMNFFVFNTDESILAGAENIWIFFAVTAPLTLVVMLVGNMYMGIVASPGGSLRSLIKSQVRRKSQLELDDAFSPEANFELPSLKAELAAGPFHSRRPQPISGLDTDGNFVIFS